MLTEEQITHPINEALLNEAEEIKAERIVVKERLAKLEETRSGVSQSVYQKVRQDYVSRLNKTAERLAVLKRDLEKEQKTLMQKKVLVERETKTHQDAIEESALRHTLGEVTDPQHQETIKQENQEIHRLEGALSELNASLDRHLKVFEGEDLSVPPPQAPQPPLSDQTSRIRVETAADTDRVASPPPAAAQPAKMAELVVFENGKATQTIPLDQTIHIGRSPANEVALKEAKVSRKHAEIQYVGGKYILLDLESSNGTFVGGKKVNEHILQPNDEIVIGNTKMVFKV